jgi:hypothetical protein
LDDRWKSAIVISHRNGVKNAINREMAKQLAAESGLYALVVAAVDSRPKVAMNPRLRRQLLQLPEGQTEGLPGLLYLVPGMPLIIKHNLMQKHRICNGVRATLERVIVDPNDTPELDAANPSVVRFSGLPLYMLVRVEDPTFDPLPGLPPGVIPISPITKKFYYKQQLRGHKTVSMVIERRQLPLIPGWAITTHVAQGQTLDRIIVDLLQPPTGSIDPSANYVALSRARRKVSCQSARQASNLHCLLSLIKRAVVYRAGGCAHSTPLCASLTTDGAS